ncbi:MAG TPA: hypothetical protein PKD79_01830 [Candidatus Doudnabacteria bacterium]|nr:hypothetical protein [Candidatus Doudnabacteria bacterium]
MEDFRPQAVKGPDSTGPIPQQVITPNGPLAPEPPSGSGKFKDFLANNKWYVLAIVLGVLIIGILATLAFWPRNTQRTAEAKVQLSIQAPQTTQAGGEVIYHINILNEDSARLIDVNLELIYDEGMSYVSSAPRAENISGTNYKVPDLATGQNAIVIVKVLAQGNVNDNKRLVARLRYKFDNFSSGFTAETNHTTRLVAANVLLDISGKNRVNSGEEVTYELSYRNTSNRSIENGRIQITYPEGFEFTSSNPSPSLGDNIWNLSTLASNQSGRISFVGTMRSSRVGQAYVITAEFLVPDETGNFFTQSSTNYNIEIASQPLGIVTRVTSGAQAGGIVRPGSTLNIEVSFQNNTQVVHTGLQALVEIASPSIVTGSIRPENGFVQDQTITWNASSSSLLEQLTAGASGAVRFQITVANPATTADNKSLSVILKPRIKSNQNEQFIIGPELVLKISSPMSLSSDVRHAGGELPPKVGQESAFTVRLSLKNNSNDYRNGVLSGFVPIGVNFDMNSVTASERNLVKFDTSTGRLTWEFGQLVAHTGVLRPERVLEFTVRTTPSSSQVNQAINLFRNVEVNATDDFTLESVKADTQDVSTSQLPTGNTNGRVVQ